MKTKFLITTVFLMAGLAGCSENKESTAKTTPPQEASSAASSPAGAPKPMPGARPFKRDTPTVDMEELKKESN